MIERENQRKMTMNKKQKGMIFLFGILFVIPFIHASNLGISPASIKFNDVLRGGYAERIIVVSVDSEVPLTGVLKPRGDIKDWLNFSSDEFVVSKDKPYLLKVSISPPKDIPNGNYNGFLRFESGGPVQSIEEHAVGTIKSSLDLAINVGVTDIEILKCSASNLEVISAEKGDDILLKMDVSNEGNIRLKPQVLLDIWDFDKISVIDSKEFLGDEILPSTKQTLEFRFDSDDFEIGQYWSDAFVPDCTYSGTLTFDVLESGALSVKGALLNILTKGEVKVGETSLIIANFKNTGEKEVDAQFRGQITKDGKIIDLLESETIKVPILSVNEFKFYFTPKSPGKYLVTGRVFYDKKKTFELSSRIDAIGSNVSFIWIIYVMFIFVIGFLFYRIRKEKRIYLDKLKK